MSKSNSNLKEKFLHELEANLWETWANFGKGINSELYQDENILWFRTPIPTIPYNTVLKFQVNENTDEEIDRIIEKLTEGGRQLMWVITPSSQPKDLIKRLEDRGLSELEADRGMARLLTNLPELPEIPDGIEIKEVKENQGKEEFIEFATWRWSVPEGYLEIYKDVIAPLKIGEPGSKTSVWQAWKDGIPVSKVSAYRAKNSIGIYGVATRPEARRMGLARLLTIHALHELQKEGHEIAILHSTAMAKSLYASIGFEELADISLYALTNSIA